MMNCYYVLVRGELKWLEPSSVTRDDGTLFQPEGFYCHRYVLASSPEAAGARAIDRIRRNLETESWLTASNVTLTLDVDEVVSAPIYKLLKPENLGHTFYSEEGPKAEP